MLLKIAVPSVASKEFRYLAIVSVLLVIRTFLSIWLADVNGNIVKAIVNRNLNQFLRRVFGLMLFAIPASTINSGMDYYQRLLALAFRERLSHYFHDRYLQKMFYYKVILITNDPRSPTSTCGFRTLTND